jgi:hypothetical protein
LALGRLINFRGLRESRLGSKQAQQTDAKAKTDGWLLLDDDSSVVAKVAPTKPMGFRRRRSRQRGTHN